MGCDSYGVASQGGIESPAWIRFSEADDDVWCLCTFPHNDGETLTPDRVLALALLGAAVVLARDSNKDGWFLPSDLPPWVVTELRRVLGVDPLHGPPPEPTDTDTGRKIRDIGWPFRRTADRGLPQGKP